MGFVMATIEFTVNSVFTEIDNGVAIADSGYPELSRGDKIKFRNYVNSVMRRELGNNDFVNAGRYNSVLNEIDVFNNSTNGKTEIDPRDEIRNAIRNVAHALSEMINGVSAPNGIDPVDMSTEFDFEFTDNSGTEFTPNSTIVSRITGMRNARAGKTNDIGELIENAMAEFPVGEFVKISRIREMIRTMENGNANANSQWDGRISARLFPSDSDCTLSENIMPVNRDIANVEFGIHRHGAVRVS
jgi:hypothetical protein